MKLVAALFICLHAARQMAGDAANTSLLDPPKSTSYTYSKGSTKLLMNYLKKTPGWKFVEKELDTCGVSSGEPKLRSKRSETRAFSLNSTDRIFGGVKAKPGQFPWMVRIIYKAGRYFSVGCGGALITTYHVLTAAHCVFNLPPGIVLSSIRTGDGGHVQNLIAKEAVFHGSYNTEKHINDIALVKVAKPAVFDDYVNALCLPLGSLAGKSFSGQSGVVAGWGRTETEESSSVLLTVSVPIIDNPTCRFLVPDTPVPIQPSQLCAGGEKGKDSCNGDSGAPLFVMDRQDDIDKDKARYYAVGVVSYGAIKCGLKNSPAIYTRVSYFVPWILSNMN